nr:melanocortin-2 receptor accessory protein 2 isoform X2 [Taeniopygia guttata]
MLRRRPRTLNAPAAPGAAPPPGCPLERERHAADPRIHAARAGRGSAPAAQSSALPGSEPAASRPLHPARCIQPTASRPFHPARSIPPAPSRPFHPARSIPPAALARLGSARLAGARASREGCAFRPGRSGASGSARADVPGTVSFGGSCCWLQGQFQTYTQPDLTLWSQWWCKP